MNPVSRRLLLSALLAGVLAGLWVARLTRDPGPGLSPDGMSYLGAAASLRAGHAPRVPFAQWFEADSTSRLRDYPPGFPAAIALLSARSTLEQGGRRVEIVAGAASAALGVLVVGSAATPVAGVITAVVLVVTPAFTEDHSIVLSEPLYLALLLGLVLLLLRPDSVLAPAFVCAAAVMTRYVGLSLAGGAALVMLWSPGPWRRRLTRAVVVSAPSLFVFVAWNHWAGGAREYGWKPGFMQTLSQGWDTVQAWLAPSVAPGAPRVVLAMAVLALLAIALWSARNRVVAVCATLALAFSGLMVFSRLFADEAIIFDNRLLTPLLACLVIALGAALPTLWLRARSPARLAATVAFLVWLAGDLALVRQQVRELDDDGWGYASRDWQHGDLAGWLRGDGARYALFSDNGPAVYSLVHRPSRTVPEEADTAAVASLGEWLGKQPSALIGFHDAYNPDEPHAGDFAARLGLRPAFTFDGGTVWLPAPQQQEHQHGQHQPGH